MKKFLLLFLFLVISFTTVQSQTSRTVDFAVIPPEYKTIPGTSTFLGPLANAARTYQLLIHESLLTQLVSKEIVGLSWRQPTSSTAAWPTSDVTYTFYDIYLSGSVPPNERSLTFANNVVGTQKLVRGGPLQILANSYPFGSTPNDFGTEITFTQNYSYSGGHLLIEIRHQGFSGTSRSVDAVSTSTAGYGTLFSGLWQSSYTPTTGSQGNFSIVKLRYEDPIPVELTSFTAKVIDNQVQLTWTTATELNNQGFEIQRKIKSDIENEWERVAFVAGFGTVTQPKSYSYTDEVQTGTYLYRLKQIDFDGSFSFSNEIEVDVNVLKEFALEQNFPNPFNPSTKISYTLAEPVFVQLVILNSLGEQVSTIVNEYQMEGKYSIDFNAQDLSSGIYFYKLTAGNFVSIKKMTLIR
jgi:hypothetical protein